MQGADGQATELELLLGVGLAALPGGLVGLERQIARKPAGPRTHIRRLRRLGAEPAW